MTFLRRWREPECAGVTLRYRVVSVTSPIGPQNRSRPGPQVPPSLRRLQCEPSWRGRWLWTMSSNRSRPADTETWLLIGPVIVHFRDGGYQSESVEVSPTRAVLRRSRVVTRRARQSTAHDALRCSRRPGPSARRVLRRTGEPMAAPRSGKPSGEGHTFHACARR
jgi:hypothetical protein